MVNLLSCIGLWGGKKQQKKWLSSISNLAIFNSNSQRFLNIPEMGKYIRDCVLLDSTHR